MLREYALWADAQRLNQPEMIVDITSLARLVRPLKPPIAKTSRSQGYYIYETKFWISIHTGLFLDDLMNW